MRVLVTGATGFVGRVLLSQLDDVVVLSRDAEAAYRSLSGFEIEAFPWDPQNTVPPEDAFENVEAVIHLAGDPVAEGRWTAAKKARMRDSRILGTRNLVQRLGELSHKPRVLVSASAVGFYGSRGDDLLDESAPPESDFLAQLCVDWEQESQAAAQHGIRVVNPRIGIVLGKGGGALAKMLTPFKLGLGGRLGSGRQWMPWIHIDDLVNLILFALRHESLSGPVNAAAPNPVTNQDFTQTLGKVLRRPTIFPVPAGMLHLALGEFASVLLASQRVVPKVALDSGFAFSYSELEPALQNLLQG